MKTGSNSDILVYVKSAFIKALYTTTVKLGANESFSVENGKFYVVPVGQKMGDSNNETVAGKIYTINNPVVLVTSITLNNTSMTIAEGESETLSVTSVLPDNADNETYTWSSSDETVATVDEYGFVTAVHIHTDTTYSIIKAVLFQEIILRTSTNP